MSELDFLKWLSIAEEDLRASKLLSENEIFAQALFYTQQCAEKALKCFLSFKNQPVKKIHDLVQLVDDCCNFDREFGKLFRAARYLKPYAIQTRYPTEYDIPDKCDTEEALQNAELILNFVKSKITKKGRFG